MGKQQTMRQDDGHRIIDGIVLNLGTRSSLKPECFSDADL